MRVLITRPIKQAQSLASALQSHNIETLIYPALQIEPVDANAFEQLSDRLSHFDWIIFTSCNAVWQSIAHLKTMWANKSTPALIAIGPATANALSEAGFTVTCSPRANFSSEGLLAEPFIQACQGKHILLLGGVGGRTVLTHQLTQCGATVEKLAVYRRCPGIKPSKTELATWQHPGIDVVISTSAEGLRQLVNLVHSAGSPHLDWLLQQQLLVMSQRLAPLVAQLGFLHKPWLATEASDTGLVARLQQCQQQIKGKQ